VRRALAPLLAALALPAVLAAQPTRPRAGGPGSLDWPGLRDEAAGLLAEYLRIDTSNPPGRELAAARWLAGVLQREGIEARVLDTAALGPGRANVWARLPGRNTSRRGAIALMHHMDVVPADSARWRLPPFAGVVRDGAVWGRGALDLKGEGIVHAMAMIALKRAGVVLDRDVVLLGVADEEVAGQGARVFVRDHPELVRAMAAMLAETGGAYTDSTRTWWFGLGVLEKRQMHVRLTAAGRAGHTMHGDAAANPVPRLARAVARLGAWEPPLRLTAPVERYLRATAATEPEAARRWLADPAAALRDSAGRALLLRDHGAVLRSTVMPTMLAGAPKLNMVPGEATADVDVRLLPDEDAAAFLAQLRRVVDDSLVRVEAVGAVRPAVEPAPFPGPVADGLARTLAALRPGVPIVPLVLSGASDAPTFAAAGVPVYGVVAHSLEPATWSGIHGDDERVTLRQLETGIRFLVRLLWELDRP
jgi:acetylornithine deacetylase/succinyl-diaminopimelate desuccinylase-like protein